MSVIAQRLRETAALYISCLEDRDAHCSKILAAANLIESLCDALREIEAATARKQLPITAQVNQIAIEALTAAIAKVELI